MIRWYQSLYMDSYVRNNSARIKEKIENNKVTIDIYCIALASNENNLFDIMNVNELLFQYYQKSSLYIVGLARGKQSAKRLVAAIIEDVYRETAGFQAREYFLRDGR